VALCAALIAVCLSVCPTGQLSEGEAARLEARAAERRILDNWQAILPALYPAIAGDKVRRADAHDTLTRRGRRSPR
jgi:hypothetical protein